MEQGGGVLLGRFLPPSPGFVLLSVGGGSLPHGDPHSQGSPPVPSPSVQVLERPLEEGGCDPEEPERRWVQGRPVPSQLLVEGSREPPHTHPGCGPRPGDPGWGHPALIPSWTFLCRALQGARGCPEVEMQEL